MERVSDQLDATHTTASGRAKRSLRIEYSTERATLYGCDYFDRLESGNPPRSMSTSFVRTIRQWMLDKGISASPVSYVRRESERWRPKYIPQERGELMLAGAIAHKIAQEGTQLYRDGGRTDIYTDIINEEVGRLREQLAATIKKQLIDGITNNNQLHG